MALYSRMAFSFFTFNSFVPLTSTRPNKLVRMCHARGGGGDGGAAPSSMELMGNQPRRSGNYPPTVWNDSTIQSLTIDFMGDNHANEIRKLKEEVRHLLAKKEELIHQLVLIDDLRQLGVAYHFEKDIKSIMDTMFRSKDEKLLAYDDNLYATSLLFRLLREHGFDVSTDVFNRFKDERGSFKAHVCNDIKGMLSMYEASFLSMEGENELEEARNLATKSLRDAIDAEAAVGLKSSLKEQVIHALELPLHWRMQRWHVRWFIDHYERRENMNPSLLKLAKLDFNAVQGIHKREIKELSKWWSNLGLGKSLGFARDRLVENYLWTVSWAFEPRLWRIREATTKSNCLITVIDDIYDVYGTLEELELFTVAVHRWDASFTTQLPEYMKICFLALHTTISDTANKTLKLRGIDVLPHLRRAWADLCEAYLVEAKWYHKEYKPTLKEYLDNAWISISGPVILTNAYCTSEDLTDDALEHFNFYPDVVLHSSMILRLSNDLVTSVAELQRGDVTKSSQCYMHHSGVSEDMARQYIEKMIASTWKKLNGNRAANSSFVQSFKNVAVGVPRMGQCIYLNRDGYGDPSRETKDQIISLLIEPIPL